MKIIIIRHADPDYTIDSITDKGKRERDLLTERMKKENVSAIYCSVFGRARDTIQPTAEHFGITPEYCVWLREFEYSKIKVPYLDREKNAWDILPSFVDANPKLYSPTEWQNVDFIKNSNVYEDYRNVVDNFDKALEKHGYSKNGKYYKVTNSNHDTIVFTCHFGLGAILVSHLFNASPYTFWQNSFLAPSSVSVFYSEEREDGIASFRASALGDISHLYHGNEEPSFSGRFCECFTDDTRHH